MVTKTLWNDRCMEVQGPAKEVRKYFEERGCTVVPPGKYGMLGMRDAHRERVVKNGHQVSELTIYWRNGNARAQYNPKVLDEQEQNTKPAR